MEVIITDGGRAAAGFKGKASGDCVTRAVAIATGLPYRTVYDALSEGARNQRRSRRCKAKTNAATGVYTYTKWFKDYMVSLGFEWVATMQIGSGCTTHLRADELPGGTIIVSLSKHFATVIDGVLHDTHDCSRGGTRCVYGYWKKTA